MLRQFEYRSGPLVFDVGQFKNYPPTFQIPQVFDLFCCLTGLYLQGNRIASAVKEWNFVKGRRLTSGKTLPTQPALLAAFAEPSALDDPYRLIAALFDSPTLGFGIIDRSLRYKAANRALAAINGLPPKAHLGKTIREVLGNGAQRLEQAARRVFATGQFVSLHELNALLPKRIRSRSWLVDYFPLKREQGKLTEIGFVVAQIPPERNWEHRLNREIKAQAEPLPSYALVAALFQGLDKEAVSTILKAAEVRRVEKGEYLYRQGETTSTLLLLRTGLVKVSSITRVGKEVLLRWVKPGEVLGLGTFAKSPLQNTWSALAVEPSDALVWDKMTVEQFSMAYPVFGQNALWMVLRCAHELQIRFEQTATEVVEQRLARVVADLSKEIKNATETPVLQVSDEELAQMIGTTLYTVSRILSRWKRLGYVQKKQRRLLIRSRESLLQIAEGSAAASARLLRYPKAG